jgi:hypothetical protein
VVVVASARQRLGTCSSGRSISSQSAQQAHHRRLGSSPEKGCVCSLHVLDCMMYASSHELNKSCLLETACQAGV